jgi:catechol 2,3-dioxygenase-like lactoylglutathione lyase family enzyme
MIDHVTLRSNDFEASKRFFAAALKPLGYEVLHTFTTPDGGSFCGLGAKNKPDLWLAPANARHPAVVGQHLAFRAATRAQVAAFHSAALEAGATDDGKPGTRKEYHPNFFGAFVKEPGGNFIEACCHAP